MPRLQHFVPPLDPKLVSMLNEVGIKTESDLLLMHDPHTIFVQLPPNHGFTLRAFHDAIAQLTQLAAVPSTYGDKALEKERKRQEDVFAEDMLVGVPAVDALIGGFSPPRVVELSGDAGSGKTALALQVALRCLSRVEDASVLWVDTGGAFSPERVSLLLEQLGGPHASTALDRLQVALAFDIEAVHDVLESVRQSFSSSNSAHDGAYGAAASPAVRCIVIDTITSLVGPMLSATSSQGHAAMTTFMRQLRAFADSFGLTIVVINTSTRVGPRAPDARNLEAVFETSRKPALGPSFTFMADATLWLSQRPVEEGEERTFVAEVFRSRISRSKTWARFRIRDGLLVDAEAA